LRAIGKVYGTGPEYVELEVGIPDPEILGVIMGGRHSNEILEYLNDVIKVGDELPLGTVIEYDDAREGSFEIPPHLRDIIRARPY
jgi:hypothetical protein